jgi:hypothetical protein
MALYRITAPDGRTYEVQGPDGATQRQVEAELLRQNPMAGLTSKELEETPRAPSTIKDIGLGGLGALAGGVQALTNIAGVDNPVSKGLGSIQQYAQENLTPARQEELAIQGELESRAQGTGLANEVGTGIRRFTQAPVQGTVNALLGSAPIIAAGFIPGGQAAAGASLGARAFAAARGTGGIGGLMGVGSQKGQDYEAVKEALLAKGLDPAIAEQRALEASSYSGENLPRQLLAGGAGALEGIFGVEQVIANAAKKVSKGVGAPSLDAPSYRKAIGLTMLGEAAPEAVQAAVGQVGTNIALNQSGVEKDLTEGLAGTVAHDALVGSVLGLAVSPAQMSNLQRQYKQTLADEQARKQAETDAQIQAATQKAEAERAVLQKQTDEIRQQMEQQQAIALPAPAEEIPVEEVQTDPLKNPLGNIRKSEVPFDIYKQIDDYRKQAGLPKLKEYSIEDFVDAMPGQNPKAEQGLLDQLITAKSGYAGEKYTAQDILNQAKLKNVDTSTKGFKDFLARTTGASALEQMSQPQLHAAFKSLNSLPASEGLNILPEGTNARRFDEKQYDKAIKGVDFLLAELGVPVDPSEVIKTIKEYTNLTEDSHAGAILDTAIKNGDVDLIKTPRYEIYDPKTGAVMPSTYTSRTAARAAAAKRGLNVRQITTDAIAAPSTSATLPEGFDIREGAFKEGEAPAGYDVLAGEETLFKANTIEEANAKKDSFERTRAGMANARENQVTQLNNAIEASQKRLTTMEAQGKGQTTGYQKAAGKHAKLVADTQAKIAALTEEIKKYDPKVTPLAVKPMGNKAIGRTGYTVFEQGQARATYPSRQAAEEGILADMDEKQLQELTQQQGRRAVGKKAQAELERRTAPKPTEGKPVSEVLQDIETEAKAEKAKAAAAKETPGLKEKMAAVEAELKPILKKFGLGDVKLNLVEKMDSEGSYNESLIKIALEEKDPVRILRHESLHALKDLNFFTPQQWNALERMAKSEWTDKYLKKVVEHKGERMSAYDAYVDLYNGDMAKVTEEAIAEAFADFANNKPPAGMLAALLKRLNDFFTALRNALNGAGFQTYEDVFGKIERGELSQKPSSWKADDTVKDDAVKYSMRFGIDPYTSEGQINVPLDGDNTRFSIKQPYDQKKLSKDETLKNDPITGLPLNANGTVTLYYPTTNESARDLAATRKLKGHSPTANRIYLTNESSSAAITNKPGMIDQPVGGANVLLQVDPSVIHLLEEHSDGRKDFFIPIAEGKAFEKKMAQTKLFTLNAPRTKGLHPDRTLKQVTTAVNDAATKWANSSAADRRIMARNAKDVLRAEHNISRLFGANSKLEKTNIGEYGLTYNGKKVMSTGLGFASAQKINDEQRATTCPQSGICEDLCLGETSGQNLLYGGEGQWRSGPRLSQYLKTEALVVNPEAFAIAMIKQIESFRKAARDLDYHPAIRLNVTSDFNPATFENIINMFPDVTFYDYTKLDTKPIAPNHHLTYSSTGASQVVGKKTIFNKFSNWDRMVDKILPSGRNVAMAFTSRSAMPKFVKDERTGKTFEVWNGDEYDARFLDPVKEGGDGLIIGLTNKDNTTKPEDAAEKHNGFFLDYDPERDGDTLVIPDQSKLKADQGQPVTFTKKPRFSLRSVPSEPGTEPIPSGTVRLYHQTDGQSLDKIAKEGLSIKYAKGIEGPKAIYAGEQPFYGAADSRPTLEFYVPKAQWDAPFVLQDVSPDQIIAAHYPWHKTARYLESEPQSMQSALDGQYDDLKDPDTSKAVEYIKEKYSKTDERLSLRAAPETEEFKQWFGDSKVVDADGKPLVVYHATSDDFDSFDPSKDRRGNGLIFFAKDAANAEATRFFDKREATQVMPVYLQIEKMFDGLKGVPKELQDWILSNKGVLKKELNEYEQDWGLAMSALDYLDKDDTGKFNPTNYIKAIAKGEWQAIEASKSLIKKIKELGYDGIKMYEEGDTYAVFKPTQVKSATGNMGAYDQYNPDIRYSLRDSTDPDTLTRVNETTTAREEKGYVERITKALGGDTFSELRARSLNRYNRLSDVDKEVVKKRGGAALMADESAEAGALQSDLAAGVTASVLGVHDRNGGIPIYVNGVTKAFNDGGKIKGPVAIFAPLSKYNDPLIYQLYQFWAGVKRGSRLNAQGKPDIFTEDDVKRAEALEAKHPEFVQIQKEWTTFNNGLVQYLVDTGVLSEGDKARFTEFSDYIPFYRQMEGEKTIGPNIFQSISGVKKPKKLSEGTDKAPLADFLETIVRNTQSSIQMGMKNVAAQRAIDRALEIEMAERLRPNAPTGLDTVQVLEKGQVVTYQVADHLFIDAVKSLNMPELPFIGLLSGPANFLRNMVTKDPGFMLANMVRDSMAAYVTSGVKMTPVADTVRNFGKAMAGTSPEFEALLNAGIGGGYEFSQNIETSGKAFEKELKKKYEGKTLFQRILNPMTAPTSLWEALEKGTTASDMATRIEVYKRTLAETNNEAEALHRALEVMNFNRKGSSPVIRILTAAIPFLNARMQGLDVLYRASFGQMNNKDAAMIQKRFIVRGLTMAALSAMYWTLTHDDEEYKKQEQETKDNNWLIPSLGIKIPIPFEIGVIFKVIPERIMALTLGQDTNKDFMDSMARNLRSTLAIDYLPQAIKPFVETETNFSLFTRRPIVGQGLEGVAPEFQVGPGTSSVAAALGSNLGMSPMKIDHLIGGYTGTMGMYMVSALDGIMNMNAENPNASKRFEQLPFIKRFALDPEARGTVTGYYDLKNATDEVVRTSSLLERTMNFEERGKFMQENIKLLANKDYILDLEKTMKEFRQAQVMIRSSRMDADAKREALLRINQVQNALTANINMIRANVM